MSRDFLASESSREFKQSPNRDRIVRIGGAETQRYFVAGERVGDAAFTNGVETLFPFPTYSTVGQIFQGAADISMPFDTMAAQLATPFVVGDIFQVTLKVEGISELYDPDEALDLQEITWLNNGSPRTSQVLYRASRAGLSIGDFEFFPLEDTLDAIPHMANNGFATGQLLLLNHSASGGTGVGQWRKRITVTARALANRPTGYTNGAGARAQMLGTRTAYEPSQFGSPITIANAARRNVDSLNSLSSLVSGLNIIHTPVQAPPIATVQPSATMFIGKVVGWQKVGGALGLAVYEDI